MTQDNSTDPDQSEHPQKRLRFSNNTEGESTSAKQPECSTDAIPEATTSGNSERIMEDLSQKYEGKLIVPKHTEESFASLKVYSVNRYLHIKHLKQDRLHSSILRNWVTGTMVESIRLSLRQETRSQGESTPEKFTQ